MSLLNNIEKINFIKLFNRGGYVLDFTTPEFDAFTFDSVGVELCTYYGMSKGQSLTTYLREASDDDAAKLILDLFAYYENTYADEIKSVNEFSKFYNSCKPVVERIREQYNRTLGMLISPLQERFSNAYISSQIDLMVQMQATNPTEAIGKAKELIESCCKTILEESGINIDKKWDMVRLTDETVKLLKITPNNIPDTIPEAKAIKAILGNLKSIAFNMAILRNQYGSGHGKSASYKGLEERHAKLAVGCSVTLVNFLWDSFDRYHKKIQNS